MDSDNTELPNGDLTICSQPSESSEANFQRCWWCASKKKKKKPKKETKEKKKREKEQIPPLKAGCPRALTWFRHREITPLFHRHVFGTQLPVQQNKEEPAGGVASRPPGGENAHLGMRLDIQRRQLVSPKQTCLNTLRVMPEECWRRKKKETESLCVKFPFQHLTPVQTNVHGENNQELMPSIA